MLHALSSFWGFARKTRERHLKVLLSTTLNYTSKKIHKVTFVLHIWLRNHFSMYLNLLLYVFLVQPFTQKIENVLHFSKNSKKTESESIQSILVSRNISWDWTEREEEVIKGVKANLGTVLSRKKLFQINFFFWLLKAYYLLR